MEAIINEEQLDLAKDKIWIYFNQYKPTTNEKLKNNKQK